MEVSVTIPTDDEGMLGRECPQPNCEKYFKIKPGTGLVGPAITGMHCPYCQHHGDSGDFHTKEQIEFAKSIAMREFEKAIHKELKKMERHSFRGSFLSMKITVKQGTPTAIKHYIEQRLQENVTCAECELEYAIFGVFAVCPDCGKQNIYQMVEANLALIEKQLELEKTLRDKFGAEFPSDVASILSSITPKMTEDACENVVTVFETFLKELNQRNLSRATDPAKKMQGNVFQRLNDAATWYQDQYGFDLFAPLGTNDVDKLKMLFAKRHLLTHNLGIIDAKFISQYGTS
jgi:Zn ribbon nucleic-acid-binding protein